MVTLDNARIAELLAKEVESAAEPVARALKRAARAAFLWPEEAEEVLGQGRSLTELKAVGPYLEKKIRAWLENPPRKQSPPPLRREFITMARARRILMTRPRWKSALMGDLQMHTIWSDGSGSVLEMAQAAEARGYGFIAITDHTKGLKIAGGIDESKLMEQGREIETVNASLASAKSPLRLLRSAEVNLNPRGEGDMDPAVLDKLDVVLGAFHSALRKVDEQTERCLGALRNPSVHILGHPRGRVYNFRLGLTADWPRVFALAADLGKAVEIDAYPDRQDLNLELVKQAVRAGCHLSVGTDAHHPWQLEFIDLGLAIAALAGAEEKRILNFKSRESLLAWVAALRPPIRHQKTKR